MVAKKKVSKTVKAKAKTTTKAVKKTVPKVKAKITKPIKAKTKVVPKKAVKPVAKTATKSGANVKSNDWVAVHYTGKFTDGKVFDSSKGRDPLVFQVGAGMVIQGFDDAVKKIKVGSETEIKIKAKEAYGERSNKEATIPKSAFQDESIMKVGKEAEIMTNMGPMLLKVTKIEKDTVKAILNHPLAGKDLVFNIKLERILDAKEVKALEKAQACDCGCDCGCEDDGCNCH